MFQLKLQFLSEQNMSLRRQLRDFKHMVSMQSQQNQKSLMFQLRQSNEQLSSQIQTLKDQLLLQRSAREIERNEHSSIVQQLNRCIYELKDDIALLEDVLRKGQGSLKQLNPLEKLFRRDREKERSEVFDKYADPVLFFQVLEGLLQYIETSQHYLDTQEIEESGNLHLVQRQHGDPFETSQHKLVNSKNVSIDELVRNTQYGQSEYNRGNWLLQKSSIYFLRKQRRQNLHLNLAKAKLLQQKAIKANEKQEKVHPTLSTNVELLKRSYVELIGQYQILKKKYRGLGRYIEQVQQRNQLLINSRKGVLS